MDIYFKVESQQKDGYKVHIGTVGKKTLCGMNKRWPRNYYKKVKHISDMDRFLSNTDVCKTCKSILPSE